ncbi:hypothetical protein CALVIDRAFT_374267 [Calocera viscosa TUFC12733]|uniref:Secreted protein n=1 Tax=Calocera viscosa (strain TUFC12733) TaxID=1330018 RepID=A0A167GSD9_CALVF|nr:hypothetical protein CALVIDRAFT_374267 [Calocera viscosa TUFC12733]
MSLLFITALIFSAAARAASTRSAWFGGNTEPDQVYFLKNFSTNVRACVLLLLPVRIDSISVATRWKARRCMSARAISSLVPRGSWGTYAPKALGTRLTFSAKVMT